MIKKLSILLMTLFTAVAVAGGSIFVINRTLSSRIDSAVREALKDINSTPGSVQISVEKASTNALLSTLTLHSVTIQREQQELSGDKLVLKLPPSAYARVAKLDENNFTELFPVLPRMTLKAKELQWSSGIQADSLSLTIDTKADLTMLDTFLKEENAEFLSEQNPFMQSPVILHSRVKNLSINPSDYSDLISSLYPKGLIDKELLDAAAVGQADLLKVKAASLIVEAYPRAGIINIKEFKSMTPWSRNHSSLKLSMNGKLTEPNIKPVSIIASSKTRLTKDEDLFDYEGMKLGIGKGKADIEIDIELDPEYDFKITNINGKIDYQLNDMKFDVPEEKLKGNPAGDLFPLDLSQFDINLDISNRKLNLSGLTFNSNHFNMEAKADLDIEVETLDKLFLNELSCIIEVENPQYQALLQMTPREQFAAMGFTYDDKKTLSCSFQQIDLLPQLQMLLMQM